MSYIHGTETDEQRRLAELNRLVNPPFLEFLELGDVRSILEVGSGLGILSREVAERCPTADVIGVEYSAEQLREALAVALPPNLQFQQGDAHALPFPDGRFNLVYCRFLLEHVPRPDVVCSEMFRVLAPGGRVFVQENDTSLQRFDPPTPLFDEVWRKVPTLQTQLGGDALVGSKLFRLLHQAGFRDVALSYAPEVYRAGEDGLTIWIDNLISIVRGCEREFITRQLASREEVDAATSELGALRSRADASSWFAWNRASGRKPRT